MPPADLTPPTSVAESAAGGEGDGVSPWQTPPAFLAHALLHSIILNELRWGQLVASLRQLSKDWRAAADAALPLLAPRPRFFRHDVAALAARVGGGLRVLRLTEPGERGPCAALGVPTAGQAGQPHPLPPSSLAQPWTMQAIWFQPKQMRPCSAAWQPTARICAAWS